MSITEHALNRFSAIPPERRRAAALWMLFWSFVLGHLNIGAYVLGWVSAGLMDAVTNYLSWMALVITALDVLLTSDVRAEVDDD